MLVHGVYNRVMNTRKDMPERRMKRLSSAVLFLPLILYLLLPTKQFYWDGVSFALDIEQAAGSLDSLLRPNHLIYNPAGYFLHELFGEKIRALFLLQELNSILGGFSILLVYHILRKITDSRNHSVCLALIMAFSATWWKFATDANAYIPSIFFLLVCFNWLWRGEKVNPLGIGIIHALAMLFHQLAIFFYPVAWVCLRRQKRTWAGLLQYSATSFLIVAGVYAGVYRHISYDGSFWDWITTHSTDSSFSFSIFHNAIVSIRSNLQLFFGGKISAFRIDVVTITGISGLAFAIGWLIKLRGEIRKGFEKIGTRLTKPWFLECGPFIVWMFVYLIFLFFWIPKNTFYRLFYLPAIVFLIGIGGRPWKEKAGQILIPFVFVLFFWNFAFFIYPNARTENNEILDFALRHKTDWPEGTTIVFNEFHPDLWTIRYFNPQAAWAGKDGLAQITESAIHSPLWLEGTAYDALKQQPEGDRWLADHIDRSRSLVFQSRKHRIRFFRAK
jgi:hypothetical protein